MSYSHRNGEPLYPRKPGAYWREHPQTHELEVRLISERDIVFALHCDSLPQTVHKHDGFYLYYGPIPRPER